MYNILIVDDEPIILSGIKSMIDWEANECHLIATARNGQDALLKIKDFKPDIVICDISMPLLNGIQLLEIANNKYPQSVFLMLTNHSDFEFVTSSLRMRAIDYLLKSQLDESSLKEALTRAKLECDARTKLSRVNFVDDYLKNNHLQVLENTFAQIIHKFLNSHTDDANTILQKNSIINFAIFNILIDYTTIPNMTHFTYEDETRLFISQKELTEKLIANFSKNYILISKDNSHTELFVLIWNLTPENYEDKINLFIRKLKIASSNITQAEISLIATDIFKDSSYLPDCRYQLFKLQDSYYLHAKEIMFFSDFSNNNFSKYDSSHSFSGQGIAEHLSQELRAKNITACASLFDKTINLIETVPHQLNQALWICNDIYTSVCDVIENFKLSQHLLSAFFSKDSELCKLNYILKRDQVIQWLTILKKLITELLSSMQTNKADILEKAKQYVQNNISKQIILQDVADYVSISPGYLSAMFKKYYNQSFFDYINQTKTEYACKEIQEGKLKIYEIAYSLGYENAYYFTKVFKKYTGCTPTEYQYKLKNDNR